MRASAIAILLLASAVDRPASALLNKPRPELIAMVEGASAIVLVRSEGIEVPAGSATRAWARRIETWKGSAPEQFWYAPDPTWTDGGFWRQPAPYAANAHPPVVLLFLAQGPTEDQAATLVDYGIIELPERDVDAFRACIRSGVEVLERAGSQTAWLVGCAARRATRGHALRDLTALDLPDQRRVAQSFVAEPSDDESFLATLEILSTLHDDELDQMAIAVLDQVLSKPLPAHLGLPLGHPYWIVPAYEHVLRRLCIDPAPRTRTWRNQWNQLWPTSKALVTDWTSVKLAYGLRPQPLADVGPSYIDSGWAPLDRE